MLFFIADKNKFNFPPVKNFRNIFSIINFIGFENDVPKSAPIITPENFFNLHFIDKWSEWFTFISEILYFVWPVFFKHKVLWNLNLFIYISVRNISMIVARNRQFLKIIKLSCVENFFRINDINRLQIYKLF